MSYYAVEPWESPIKLTLPSKLTRPALLRILNLNSNNKWRTKYGDEIKLSDMNIDHLKNAIHFCNKRNLREEAQMLGAELFRRKYYENSIC